MRIGPGTSTNNEICNSISIQVAGRDRHSAGKTGECQEAPRLGTADTAEDLHVAETCRCPNDDVCDPVSGYVSRGHGYSTGEAGERQETADFLQAHTVEDLHVRTVLPRP